DPRPARLPSRSPSGRAWERRDCVEWIRRLTVGAVPPDEQARVVVRRQPPLVPPAFERSYTRRVATPDLRKMRYFTAVAESGSLTGAARELHVAQQAVSQQVKALEQLLGVTLLERGSRRVRLTPEGVVFLADCRRVLAGADRAARRVQAAARGEAGTL